MSQFKKKLTAFTAMLTFLTLSSAAAFAVSTGDVLGNATNMGFSATGSQFNVDLNSGMNDFTNGGHVYEGEPLANSEFNGCINKIDSAISNIDNIITRYNNDKSALIQEKNGLQAKLN